jgi:hypothetical protein
MIVITFVPFPQVDDLEERFAVGIALVQRACLSGIAPRRAGDVRAIGGHLRGGGDAPQQDVPIALIARDLLRRRGVVLREVG